MEKLNKGELRAVSMHQPWADLIAFGHKTICSMHYNTEYRGKLLICSAKKWDKGCKMIMRQFQNPLNPRSPFKRPLFPDDYTPRLGLALAVAHLEDCAPMCESDRKAACYFQGWNIEDVFAWHLRDVTPICPIPIKGRPGLFHPGIEQSQLMPVQIPLFQQESQCQTLKGQGKQELSVAVYYSALYS